LMQVQGDVVMLLWSLIWYTKASNCKLRMITLDFCFFFKWKWRTVSIKVNVYLFSKCAPCGKPKHGACGWWGVELKLVFCSPNLGACDWWGGKGTLDSWDGAGCATSL
jgi:hypothetical protein